MPFKQQIRPSLQFWTPGNKFDQVTDRLHVSLNWQRESLILAWSSDGDEPGSFILAPEAIPKNLFFWELGLTSADCFGPDEGFYVTQHPELNTLNIELSTKEYHGRFETAGGLEQIRPALVGMRSRYSDTLSGYWRVKPRLKPFPVSKLPEDVSPYGW